MKIFIAGDHRTLEMKQMIIGHLQQLGHEVVDLGPHQLDPTDDYPDYAIALGEQVAANPNSCGIVMCNSGTGVTIAANKVKGVRAAYVESEKHAFSARNDDDANVMCLDKMTFDTKIDYPIIDVWLKTPFGNAERYIRRRDKISNYENK